MINKFSNSKIQNQFGQVNTFFMHQQHTAKVMGTLPLTKGSEKINHPGINLEKEVKDLCSGNVTLLKKEREESDKVEASPARGLIELVLWKRSFIKSYLKIQ